MSGLETVAAVAGIVSAVVGVSKLITKAIGSRKVKKIAIRPKVEAAENQLMTTFEESPQQINSEFHRDLARAGMAIAKGDANTALLRILSNLNTSIVSALEGFMATGQVLFNISQYHDWNTIGVNATRETVRTLSQLLQRSLQNAPIPPAFSDAVKRLEQIPSRKIVLSPNGDKYEGECKDGDVRHGFGKLTTQEYTYIGDWEEGMVSGYGVQEWVLQVENGTAVRLGWKSYEGSFHAGKLHGFGKASWYNGSEYVGGFQFDFKHGYGVQTWSRSVRYEGEWVYGKAQGIGHRTWANGAVYRGEFYDDKCHGYGVMKYHREGTYKGYWLEDKYQR